MVSEAQVVLKFRLTLQFRSHSLRSKTLVCGYGVVIRKTVGARRNVLAYLEFRLRCAGLIDVGKGRGLLQKLFFLAVLKQDGGARVAQAP